MSNIKLDKEYNLIEEKGAYNDDLVDNVELIKEAQAKKLITEKQASLLVKMALAKEFRREAKTVLPFSEKSPEIVSLFMSMKDKQVKHV